MNAHTSPITITDLTFVSSCSNFEINCAGGPADPGAFTFSPTGTGRTSSACSDMTFNLTMVNPTTGQMRVRRADNQNISLTQMDIGSDLDICRINFTIKTNRAPNYDTRPELDGIQTNQNLAVSGVINGTVDNSTNNDITTVVGSATARRRQQRLQRRRKVRGDAFRSLRKLDEPGKTHRLLRSQLRFAVPADYDGDRDVDRAVFRDGAWYVQGMPTVHFGLAGDIPVPGDYNGDGRVDRAVYRNGAWHVEGQPVVYFGLAGDIPVPADYNGDGNTDRAVYRNGAWYVEGMSTVYFGLDGDIPVPGDYNGDGRTDRAIYRNGAWYIQGLPTVFSAGQGTCRYPVTTTATRPSTRRSTGTVRGTARECRAATSAPRPTLPSACSRRSTSRFF